MVFNEDLYIFLSQIPCANRMLKSGVNRTRKDIEKRTKLLYIPQPLKFRSIDKIPNIINNDFTRFFVGKK